MGKGKIASFEQPLPLPQCPLKTYTAAMLKKGGLVLERVHFNNNTKKKKTSKINGEREREREIFYKINFILRYIGKWRVRG